MKKIYTSILLWSFLGTIKAQVIQPSELHKWIEKREKGEINFLLIDVRTGLEHLEGFIPGTDTLIPLQYIQKEFPLLNINSEKDTIVIYCRTGHRAGIAQKIFKEKGYKFVFNALGIKQWQEAGFKLEKVKIKTVPASRVCMTDNTVSDRELIPVEYKGKTYYGCCMGCVRALKANPEKFRWAYDPVSGEKVDKADAVTYNYKGRAIYFSNIENLKKFAAEPEKYSGKN